MKKTTLLLILFFLFQTMCSQSKERIDWKVDLDYLGIELSEKHFNFFAIKSKDSFLSRLDVIKRESDKLTDFQIALKVQQLIAQFGDSHTMLYLNDVLDNNKMLPIKLFWTSDGIHVLWTTTENKDILGSELLAVNDVPIATVIDSIATLFTLDNEAMIKSLVPNILPSVQILEYFGFTKDKQVTLTTDGGRKYILKVMPVNKDDIVVFKPDSISFALKNEKEFFTDYYYLDEKTYHILYNKCWSKESELQYGNKEKAESLPSFSEFEDKVLDVLSKQSVEKIIFDMRFNGGGNSAPGTAFVEKLAEYEKKHPNVKIYIVLGRNTFSSAILNAMDFKRLTKAIFIGEETAGKPNHFGEVRGFQLPNSKLHVAYSTKYFKNTDEDVNTLKPDVEIDMSFSDFAKGIDPIFEWVKQQ